MLNHITIMGRLTRDPELRRTGSGIAVANFTVAVDRDFPKKKPTSSTALPGSITASLFPGTSVRAL